MDFTFNLTSVGTASTPLTYTQAGAKNACIDPDTGKLYYLNLNNKVLTLRTSTNNGSSWVEETVFDYLAEGLGYLPNGAYIAIAINPIDKSAWVVVSARNATYERRVDVFTNQSGTWVKSTVLSVTGVAQYMMMTDIVVTEDENVHVLIGGKTGSGDPDESVWYSYWNGSVWSSWENIFNDGDIEVVASMARLLKKRDNELIAVWWADVSGAVNGTSANLIIRERSAAGVWGTRYEIDDASNLYWPAVAFDPWDNTLHVAAIDWDNLVLVYGRWHPSRGFTDRTVLSTAVSPDWTEDPYVSVDRAGNVFVFWLFGDEVGEGGLTKLKCRIFDGALQTWSDTLDVGPNSSGVNYFCATPFYTGDYVGSKPVIGASLILKNQTDYIDNYIETVPYYRPGADPEVSAPGTIYSSVNGSFFIYQTVELESFASTFNIGYDEGFIFQESFDVLAEVFSSVSGDYDIWKIKEFWKNSNRSALTGRYNVRKLLIGPSASGIYNVRELNEVNSVVLGYYDIQSGIAAIESYANAARVWLDGVDITGKILSCRVSYSESDFTGTVDITFADWTMYHLVDPMDLTQFGRLRITVETLRQRVGFPDEWVNQGDFFLEKRSVSADYGSTVPTIWGRSRPALLSNPYASPYTRTWSVVTTAYEVAREVIDTVRVKHPAGAGIVFRWEIMDYAARAGKFAFSGVLPIDVLNAIAAPIGGVVSTNKDGDIIVKYKWDNVADIIARQEIL